FDAVLFHGAPNEREHRDELAEDEDLVSAFDRRLYELAKRDELARIFVAELTRKAEQARIAGGLTKTCEAREDLDVALRHSLTLDLAHHLCADFFEDSAVESRLLAGELAELIALDLLGKILGDLGFRASEDERMDRRAKALGGLLVTRVDRSRVALFEFVEWTEETRTDEIEDRPDLGEAILD